MSKVILVTGTRHGPDEFQMADIRKHLGELPAGSIVRHGAARGVDTFIGSEAKRILGSGVTVEKYPADWDRYGKAAGFRRNHQMVDLGADEVWAYPGQGPGTVHCMKAAHEAGITVYWMFKGTKGKKRGIWKAGA